MHREKNTPNGSNKNGGVNDIDSFLADKNLELRSESSITADFYKSTNGEYETHLIAMEKDSELISIKLSIPTKEMAQTICDSWYTKNQQIYKYLMQELFYIILSLLQIL